MVVVKGTGRPINHGSPFSKCLPSLFTEGNGYIQQ